MAGFKAYTLSLSSSAEAAYRRIVLEAKPHLESGDTTHAKVKHLRLVDECLDKIIPHDPFSPKRALTGELSNIFRVKKGRTRICYVGSSQQYELIVLYISETPRKEGDTGDPYHIFSGLVLSGEYDHIFDALGIKRPNRALAANAASLQ